MNADIENKELRILAMMRKTLTGIVRETAGPAGTRLPFSEATVANIRDTLGLIDARQRELANAKDGGGSNVVPLYPDQRAAPGQTKVKVSDLLKDDKPKPR